jgi:hypothetical protein
MDVGIYIRQFTKSVNVAVFLKTSVIAKDSRDLITQMIRIPKFQKVSINYNKPTEIRK